MKILIVSENRSDFEVLRKVTTKTLSKSTVITAVNKNQAIENVCNDGPFDFYIIDVDMEQFNVESLVKDFINLSGEKPFLFTGTQNSFEANIPEAVFQSNDLNEYLAKPYERDDFPVEIEAILLNYQKHSEQQSKDNSLEQIDPKDFIAIKIGGLYIYDQFPYDVYLEITKTRYLKLLPANVKFGHSFLASYAKRNVKFLHVKQDEHLKYLDTQMNEYINNFKTGLNNENTHYTAILKSITILHQYIQAIGVTKKTIILIEELIQEFGRIQKNFPTIESAFEDYPYYYEGISSKSVITGIILLFFTRTLEWDSQTTKNKFLLASIMQDYSLPDEKLSKVVNLKDPILKEISEEHFEQFKNHPKQSALIVEQFTHYPETASLVLNQHEFPSRRGFPSRPVSAHLSQMNLAFNMSQYMASKIDGLEYREAPIATILKGMKKDFGIGNANETLELFKKTMGH